MTSSKPAGVRQVPPPQGSTAKPANAYARFIPREELAGFASWTPDAFGGGGVRSPHPGQPQPEPELPLEPAAPPEPDAAEWLARIEAARQAGYQDGYRDGLEALEAAKRQNAQQISAQVAQVVAAFDDQVQALESRMADAVVDTAVRLARQVVRSELSQPPGAITQVAMDAIQALVLSARHLRLRLNPADVALVQAGAGDLLKARAVVLQPDAGLLAGGLVLESDLGQVDARIEQRWAQAAAVFGSPLPWLADEPEDTPSATGGAAPEAAPSVAGRESAHAPASAAASPGSTAASADDGAGR